MKKDIHPKTHEATIRCHCGNESTLLSTKGENIDTEICSACHPFYTGKQRFIDTAGRIDRFNKKYEKFNRRKKKGEAEA
jgi:large subunit ribosomal protein L31